jgi:hypothetical protein
VELEAHRDVLLQTMPAARAFSALPVSHLTMLHHHHHQATDSPVMAATDSPAMAATDSPAMAATDSLVMAATAPSELWREPRMPRTKRFHINVNVIKVSLVKQPC